MHSDSTHIGANVRTWRRRRGGMSQKTLADLSGLSQSYISQIESGRKPVDRKSTQVALASALNVSVAQLLHRDHPSDPALDRASRFVPAIRAALIELSAQERRTPTRDRDTLRRAVVDLSEQRNRADYAALFPDLPPLLVDLAGHGTDMAPQLIETLFVAQFALRAIGQIDLARQAAEIGVRTAEDIDAPEWRGSAAFSWVQAFPPENSALALRLIDRACLHLQRAAGRPAQETYGRLHLMAALHSSVMEQPDRAYAHLGEAADVARALGEPERYGPLSAGITASWFGPTQVDVWQVSIAAELGDTGRAIAVADQIQLTQLPLPNRHVYYWTDLARALAADGRDQQAMLALAQAERAAPQHFRASPVALSLVNSLIERAKRRAVAVEFARLASRLGIHPY